MTPKNVYDIETGFKFEYNKSKWACHIIISYKSFTDSLLLVLTINEYWLSPTLIHGTPEFLT